MTDDIAARLRMYSSLDDHLSSRSNTEREAANEIERLRSALKFYKCGCKKDSCAPEKLKFRRIKCGWIARAALKETGNG